MPYYVKLDQLEDDLLDVEKKLIASGLGDAIDILRSVFSEPQEAIYVGHVERFEPALLRAYKSDRVVGGIRAVRKF